MTPELWQKVVGALAQARDETPENRAGFLEGLHRNDPELGSVVESLLQRHEATKTWNVSAGSWPVPGESAIDFPAQVGPYRIEEVVGWGGMGIVLRGMDPQFKRRLAIKVLAPHLRGDEGLKKRFLAEAQIMGQLQHPGIPPVHELGELADGRPFLAMKLVQGQTLAQLLPAEEQTPGPAELPRFVAIFGQICQTVAYAHSRGILHRDLKPGNVMVGAFGEVQVMDWGLAKFLRPTEEAITAFEEQSPVFQEHDSPSPECAEDGTQAGVALGTPAYMAPEQARGELDQIDERCDVFALGAMLCRILTGRPPYEAGCNRDIIALARGGQLAAAFARLDGCGADVELIALAKHCLSPEAQKRPAQAGEVAAAVAAYQAALEQRLQQAEIDKAAALVQAEEEQKRRVVEQAKASEERRRRRLTLGLAALALIFLATAAAAALWYLHDQNQRAAALARKRDLDAQAVATAVEQARQVRASLHKELQVPGGVFELLNQPDRWAARIQAARSALEHARSLRDGAAAGIDPRLDAAIQELATFLDRDDADRSLAMRLDQIRLDKASRVIVGKLDNAKAAREYPRIFFKAGLPVLTGDAPSIVAVFAASPIKEQLVAALDDWSATISDQQELDRLQGVTRLVDPDPRWKDRLRQSKAWNDKQEVARLAQESPANVSPQAHFLMTLLLRRNGLDVLAWLRKAQALYPRDFWLNFELGNEVSKISPIEAEGYFRVALAVRPQNTAAHMNLGLALHHQKRLDEAIAEYRKAIASDKTNTLSYSRLGNALRDQKKLDEAIAVYRQAIAINSGDMAAYTNLGISLREQNRFEEAVAAYHKALEIDPKSAAVYNNLGFTLYQQKRLDEAIAAYQKAIDLNPQLAVTHINLGTTLQDQKRTAEAIAALQRAISLNPKIAQAYLILGNALQDHKRHADAIDIYQKALELDPQSASAHNNLGYVLDQLGRRAEAITYYQKAIDLDAKFAVAWNNLGSALRKEKRWDEAVAAYRMAIDLGQNQYAALGQTLLAAGSFAEAAGCLQKALKLIADNDPARGSLQRELKHCQQMLVLEKRLPLVLENTGPVAAAELLALARLCQDYKQRHATAAQLYRDAFRAQPALAEDFDKHHRFQAACAAAAAGRGRGADAQKLSEKDKASLRHQARAWLQADLDLAPRLLKKGAFIEAIRFIEGLPRWQKNPDLAGVRDANELASLPTEEQEECRKLWAAVEELIRHADTVLAADPKVADAYSTLADGLLHNKDTDGAISSYAKALKINPQSVPAHYGLSCVYYAKKDWDRAAQHFEKILAIDPKYALAHLGLGNTLFAKNDLDGAIQHYQKAATIAPGDLMTRSHLGYAFYARKDWDLAMQHYQKALLHDPRHPLTRQRVVMLFEALLKGKKIKMENAREQLELAGFCHKDREYFAAAAHWYARAFAGQPALVEDLDKDHRFQAACAAALAAAGKGKDTAQLDAREKSQLRGTALAWLRTELDRCEKLLKEASKQDAKIAALVAQRLRHWQEHPPLASVREEKELATLPKDEQETWRALWRRVTRLIKDAGAAP